jgi:hypothetical protein
MLQVFGRELRIDDGILISSIRLRIESEAFDTFPAQLKFEPPDILVGVERVRVALGDESKEGDVRRKTVCLYVLP